MPPPTSTPGCWPSKAFSTKGKVVDEWTEPGWTGSRGDIVRALTAPITEHYQDHVELEFGSRVTALDVHAGKLTYESDGDQPIPQRFDLIVGADGAGSMVRRAMHDQVQGFTVETRSIPNYVTMIELDRVRDRLHRNYLQAPSIRHFWSQGRSRAMTACQSHAGSVSLAARRSCGCPPPMRLAGT